MQHGDVTGPVPMPQVTLSLIARRRIPCAALLVTRRFLAWNEAHMREPMRSTNLYKDENDRRLIAAGAPLLLTTDSGLFPSTAVDNPLLGDLASADDSHYVMGEAHFRWLQAAAELPRVRRRLLRTAPRRAPVSACFRRAGHSRGCAVLISSRPHTCRRSFPMSCGIALVSPTSRSPRD